MQLHQKYAIIYKNKGGFLMSRDIEKKMILAYISVGKKISGESKNETNLKNEKENSLRKGKGSNK